MVAFINLYVHFQEAAVLKNEQWMGTVQLALRSAWDKLIAVPAKPHGNFTQPASM